MRVNTATIGAATLAVLALSPLYLARAEEIYRESNGVSCLPDGSSCATFQGYIYVHRDGAPAAAHSRDSGEAELGERRLYLHLGAD